MRLLTMPWASAAPFFPLFEEVRNFLSVPIETIGENDVILYGGGTDVNPKYYGQEPHVFTQMPDEERDELEIAAFHTLKGKVKGFIGICRGMQLLTVLHGGKLVQHIGREHCRDHMVIDFATGRRIPVTSAHHQLCYPFDLPNDKYQVLAAPPQKIARAYEFGLPAGKEPKGKLLGDYIVPLDDVPQEPEVIWFPEYKSLGIQGHPEWVKPRSIFAAYSNELVKKYILGKE